jgi:hypothetical protein
MRLPLLFAVLLGIASVANAGFEAEPNNTTATATPMKLNEVFTASFDNTSTDDYYKIVLTKPTEIVFNFRLQPTANSDLIRFTILDLLGATIFSDYRYYHGSDASNFKVNLVAGTFYVKIDYLYNNDGYELSAQSPLAVSKPITIPSVISSVNMPDLNSNGYKDMAVLRILADARAVVDTLDGFTGALIKRVVYITDSRLIQPISLISFDLDGNGAPDIGVLGYNSTTGKHAQYIRNALTGVLVKSFVIN